MKHTIGTVKCKILRSSKGFPLHSHQDSSLDPLGGLQHSRPRLHKTMTFGHCPYRAFGMITHNSKFPFNLPKATKKFLCLQNVFGQFTKPVLAKCVWQFTKPGLFFKSPRCEIVLPGEFLLIYPKIFERLPGVLQRGVIYIVPKKCRARPKPIQTVVPLRPSAGRNPDWSIKATFHLKCIHPL